MPTHAFARTAKQASHPPSPQKARIQNFVQKCLDDLQYKTGAKLLGVPVKWHLNRGYEINLVCTMLTHPFAQNAQQASQAPEPQKARIQTIVKNIRMILVFFVQSIAL